MQCANVPFSQRVSQSKYELASSLVGQYTTVLVGQSVDYCACTF